MRTPPDQRSVANSPGLIAGSYVLHRLLMPRHPPCALHSLSHTPPTQPTTRNTAHRPHKKRDPTTPPHRDTAKPHQSQQTTTDDESDMAVHTTHYKDARVHYPDLKQQPHTRTNAPPSDETSSSRVRQAPRTRTEAPDTPPHSHSRRQPSDSS